MYAADNILNDGWKISQWKKDVSHKFYGNDFNAVIKVRYDRSDVAI